MKGTVLKLPVLVVTPHSSGFVPHDVLAQMLGERAWERRAREERLARLLYAGDPFTDVIFSSARARMWHAGVSRFVVDVGAQRTGQADAGYNDPDIFPYQDAWQRRLYPDGFELTPAEREERLRRYWDPFHDEIERSIVMNDVRLLVTGHAMLPVGPPLSRDEGQRRPALALVTNGGPDGEPHRGRATSVPPRDARALHGLLEVHFGDIVARSDRVPHDITLNAPRSAEPMVARYSDPLRPRPVPGFALHVNRGLYLGPEGGREVVDEQQLYALSAAFERFVRDAVLLFHVA